jgi:hypothetical protein
MAAGAVVAVVALTGVAGCGAAGSGGATGAGPGPAANGALGFNGPFGLGGPFEGAPLEGAPLAGAPLAGAPLAGDPLAGGGITSGGITGAGLSGGGIGAAGLAGTTSGKSRGAVKVDGSTALDGVAGMPWLFALGAGVRATAPPAVRPGTSSPADAAAGFYQAFYDQRFTAACDYVAPARQAGCPVLLRESSGSADALHTPAIGFTVVKGAQALVTMTGVLCRAAGGCVGQHDPHWIFDSSYTFDQLWALTADAGGNPLTVTPLAKDAGRWYVDLTAAGTRPASLPRIP